MSNCGQSPAVADPRWEPRVPSHEGSTAGWLNSLPVGLFPPPAGAVPAPLRVGACEVFVGTCSWADRGLVASDFYPRGSRTRPRARLQHYATVFPTVEVDASYHALQPPERARQWLAWTPPSFRFNVKAFAWLTRHESDPRRLPPGIAALLPTGVRHGGPVAGSQVPEEALAAAWDAFAAFVDVFAQAGRLGYVLFQFPKGRGFSTELLTYLDTWAPYLRAWPVAVEIRHRDWLDRPHRQIFLGYLRERRFAYVIPDLVQARYLPPPELVVTTDWSVVRFHGRNPALLERRASTDRAYDYLYSSEELQAWAHDAQTLADRVRVLYVMFNNHARGQAARNARQMLDLLAGHT